MCLDLTNDKKVTLYFVRHGETQYNVEKRMQGFCDSPLTERGIFQAKSVGKGLSHINFKAAYSSDSQRVLDTAKYAIGNQDIPLIIDPRLKEMNFGVLESLLEEEIFKEHGNILEKLFSFKNLEVAAPDGESYVQLFTRTTNAVGDIIKKHSLDGGNVLIFSHGITIGNYILQITQSDQYPVHENCSVSVVSYINGRSKVEKIADTHYREEGSKYLMK